MLPSSPFHEAALQDGLSYWSDLLRMKLTGGKNVRGSEETETETKTEEGDGDDR